MATREDQRAAREAKLDQLHETLTGAVKNLVTGQDWLRALAFAAKFRTRSFNNSLLIWTQHQAAFEQGRVQEPTPTLVAGYRQWQSLSRQVEKGQAGYQIFAPVTGRFASSTPADSASWRRLGKGERPRAGEVVRSKMIAARPAYVWDVSQTDGDPIPERPEPVLLEGQAPSGLWEGLAAQVRGAGFAVLDAPDAAAIHGANGLTDYMGKTVSVRGDMSDAARVKTLAHELGHIVLHDPANEDVRLHRGIVEVEAESVALMIGAAHGMDTSAYTVPYVAGWAFSVPDTDPVEVIATTGERVRKAALGILDRLDTVMVSDGTPPGLNRQSPPHDRPLQGAAEPSRLDARFLPVQGREVVRGL